MTRADYGEQRSLESDGRGLRATREANVAEHAGARSFARWSRELGDLVGPRRSNTAAMTGIGDAGEKVRATRAAQAWNVRAALIVGVGELHAVVLPPADGADLKRARRSFVEREASAARARPSIVRALARRDGRRDEHGLRPRSIGGFTERFDVVAVRARRVDLEARRKPYRRTRRAPLGIDALIDRRSVTLTPDPEIAVSVLALPCVESRSTPRTCERRERLVPVEHSHDASVRLSASGAKVKEHRGAHPRAHGFVAFDSCGIERPDSERVTADKQPGSVEPCDRSLARHHRLTEKSAVARAVDADAWRFGQAHGDRRSVGREGQLPRIARRLVRDEHRRRRESVSAKQHHLMLVRTPSIAAHRDAHAVIGDRAPEHLAGRGER